MIIDKDNKSNENELHHGDVVMLDDTTPLWVLKYGKRFQIINLETGIDIFKGDENSATPNDFKKELDDYKSNYEIIPANQIHVYFE